MSAGLTPQQSGLAAIVLAGGRSRRMGEDKAQLQLQGEALLTRACRLVQTVGEPWGSPHTLVIATRADYQPLLTEGCELLLEEDSKGPLVAFSQGLEWFKSMEIEWVLLLACDLPLLTAEDLACAMADLPKLPAEVDAYLPPAAMAAKRATEVPQQKQVNWEPLCGFYRRRCATALDEAVARGVRSFQGWLTELNVAALNHWPAEHLLNCNRPEDWAWVQAQIGDR